MFFDIKDFDIKDSADLKMLCDCMSELAQKIRDQGDSYLILRDDDPKKIDLDYREMACTMANGAMVIAGCALSMGHKMKEF